MKFPYKKYTSAHNDFQGKSYAPTLEENKQMPAITSRDKSESSSQNQFTYPRVTIIIPTYKDWHRLAACLDALDKQSYPKERFEIIVVNNGSEDIVPKGFQLPLNAVLICESKAGSYAARNAGLKLAKGEIIGFTDSDCVPSADWIISGVSYLQSNPACTRVAGKFEILLNSKTPSIIEVYNTLYSFPQQAVINNHGGSMTGNLSTYKSVFNNVGLFNDQYFSYGDLEWGRRANAAGFNVEYVDDVVVFHPARTFRELLIKEKRLGGGVAYFFNYEKAWWYYVLQFFYSFKPSSRALRYMVSKHRFVRTVDILTIPVLRYFFGLVRSFEILRVRLGKSPNRF